MMKGFTIKQRLVNSPPSPKSEDEIVKGWKGDIHKPRVSILCIAYNHAPYIEETLNGFLMQETEFPFEVIVHDDASFDGTQEIIQRYRSQYPNIIKTILQEENQYSKGRRAIGFFVEHVRGDYCAFCEGDDFWVSPDKLALQYRALESNPAISMSFHSFYSGSERYVYKSISRKKIRIIPTSKMIAKGPSFVALASVMIKKEVLESVCRNTLEYPVGDYFIQVMGSYPDGAIYVSGLASFYRVNHKGSWTEKSSNSCIEKKIQHWSLMSKGLVFLDDYTKNNYPKSFSFYSFVRLINLVKGAGNDKRLIKKIILEYASIEPRQTPRLLSKILFYHGLCLISVFLCVSALRIRALYAKKWISLF
jgi:glycosyltransferase involved in cell wall biosynthesis